MEAAMTDQDYRQSNKLTFDTDLNWVNFPRTFPYQDFASREHWAAEMAMMVHYVGTGRENSPGPPTEEWYDRTRVIIRMAHENLIVDDAHYQFLLFHDLNVAPTAISVNRFFGDLPWEEVRPVYTGELNQDIVEGPFVEDFPMDDTEVALRALRYHYLDPKERTLSAHYHHAFRRDRMDVVVRSMLIDLSALRDATPALDAFARGIGITFDS
jgi:hypothetical protein